MLTKQHEYRIPTKLWIRAKLRDLSAMLGVQLKPIVRKEALEIFINALRPVATNHQLIRIGDGSDGGYLIPDDLSGISYCFSPGVNETSVFEEHLLKDWGIPSFLADFSVSSPPPTLMNYKFEKKYVGASNDDKTITMDDWIDESLGHDYSGDLLLQMDIESAEYEVMLSTSTKKLKCFRIIVLELHQLHRAADPIANRIMMAFLRKMNQNHQIVHIHPNNSAGVVKVHGKVIPELLEVTWLRRDRISSTDAIYALPHRLDIKNDESRNEIHLTNNWH